MVSQWALGDLTITCITSMSLMEELANAPSCKSAECKFY